MKEMAAAKTPSNGLVLEEYLGCVRHTITSNKLEVAVYRGRLKRALQAPSEQWVPLDRLHELPVTTITRKAVRLAAAQARLIRPAASPP